MRIFFFDIETVPTEPFLRDSGVLQTPPPADENDILKRLSLSGATARILCLAYAIEPEIDSRVQVLEGDEAEIIKGFWQLITDCDLLVGHNILDFDLRFIYQRSIIHRIKPSRDLPFERYQSAPIFDTMQEWCKWGRDRVGLDLLARALGIPSPKESLDGSKVYPYYCAGRLAEICEYCKRDVETVRRVYRRLTFSELPE
jgi:3'-5' exonuclease